MGTVKLALLVGCITVQGKPSLVICTPLVMRMLRSLFPLLCLLLLTSCEETNLFLLTDAASDAVTAITLSDEQVRQLAQQARTRIDRQLPVAGTDTPYARRLRRLLDGLPAEESSHFDIKVYLTGEVNAFALADGTIRIYAGLMDLMDDGELLFVIGHEMGHVVEEHVRKKMALAYAASALRKGLAAQENEVGLVASSMLGGFVEQLTAAQFSQHEERQADLYGVAFLRSAGYDPGAAQSALKKLAALPGRHTFLSSHPAPQARIQALLTDGDQVSPTSRPSVLATALHFAQAMIAWLAGLIRTLLGWLLSLL